MTKLVVQRINAAPDRWLAPIFLKGPQSFIHDDKELVRAKSLGGCSKANH
jgi:hypothetical protein